MIKKKCGKETETWTEFVKKISGCEAEGVFSKIFMS